MDFLTDHPTSIKTSKATKTRGPEVADFDLRGAVGLPEIQSESEEPKLWAPFHPPCFPPIPKTSGPFLKC